MDNIIENFKEIKKFSEETFKIPFGYVLFLILNIFIHTNLGDNWFQFIFNYSYILNILQNITHFLDVLYSHYLNVVLSIGLVILLILAISEWTPIFSNIFPKDRKLLDGTVESWNQYSGINRLFNFLLYFTGPSFIYFMFLSYIIRPDIFSISGCNVSFDVDFTNNILWMNYEVSQLYSILWSINQFALICFCLKSIFLISYKDDFRFFSRAEIDSFFIVYESFEYTKNSFPKDIGRYLICKNKRSKVFYLLKVHETKLGSNNSVSQNKWIPIPDMKYYIEDESNNFEEIRYLYNIRKEELLTA